MARTIRNAKLDSRSARLKPSERREPYWTVISAGSALGYRRGANGGTWIAKMRGEDGRRHYASLGAADDARDPDGLTVFSFAQAQEAARTFFTRKARELAGHGEPHAGGPYTVKNAIDDYFAARERRGSKSARKDSYQAEARIIPKLGAIEAARLTPKTIRDWHQSMASAAKLVRTKKSATQETRVFDTKDPEEVRKRRATANRLLTILKAALNHAFQEGRLPVDEPWRRVKPFREVDTPVVHFLKADECVRLVNACEPSFRAIVRGALVTGCRYGELTRMRAADFNAEAGTITVRVSKSGKPRHVVLNEEGQRLFATLAAGRPPQDLVFRRDDGDAWGASHQQRPLEEASRAAKLDPPATFHILRHTYASALAMKGAPMGVIAVQLGHSDTRMTEKHYAHLAPSYVADTVRAALPGFGILGETKVTALKPRSSS